MKADKIRGTDVTDLERQAQDAQEQLFRLRFQMGMGQFEGLKKYRALKKDRARMLTVLSEKRSGSGESVAATPVVAGTAAPKKRK
jgi:large subunit ribosomal protein L29